MATRNGIDETKGGYASLKNQSSNDTSSSNIWKCLIPFVAGAVMASFAMFIVLGQSAQLKNNPIKVLLKDCKSVCSAQSKKRIDRYGGDPVDNAQLLNSIKTARDKAIHSLKLDYGEKYFSDIFEENEDGKLVIRKAFVPAKSSASTQRFQRKLQMKLLKVQTAIRSQEKSVHGCDCVTFEPTKTVPKVTNSGQNLRRLQDNSDPLAALDDDDSYAKFIWTTGGHSAAAGHGNLFNESYTAYMERAVADVFASAGIEFIGKNYAMGGMKSSPEIALCAEAIFGSDTDAVSWDFGMTDGARMPWTFRLFLYNNRASLLPSRPSLFGIHYNTGEQRQIYSYFEENGLVSFLFDLEAEKKMHDSVPDCLGLSTTELSALPPLVRNFKCEGKIESGEPYCDAEKYTKEICADRKHKASWHPGWKDQALVGNAAGLFLMESLVEAAQDLNTKSGEPDHILELLTKLDEAEHDTFLKSNLPENLMGGLDPVFGEMEKTFAEVKPKVFLRDPSICHTGLLPAETRYNGYLTESDKTGLFDYDTGRTRQDLEANPPKEKDVSPMRLGFDPQFRQSCSVTLTMDFKDYFYTSRADGWTTLTIPNDSEAKAYNYDGSKMHGVVMICFSACDWGRCEEGDLQPKDVDEGKASFEVNGKPVKSIVQFDLCHLLKGDNGFKWTANNDGRFVFKARVNVDKSYLRLSSVIVF